VSSISSRIAAAAEREAAYADGERIVAAGEPGTEMFVVKSGGVVISRQVNGRDVELDRLGRGQFFGEMSLLESLPRDADVRAVGPTRLLVLGQGGLLLRLRRDPSFGLEMLQQLSSRVRALNAKLDAVSDPEPP
jgi:CRP-like cAMP-binding protein